MEVPSTPFTLHDLRDLLRVEDAAELTSSNSCMAFSDLGYDSLAMLEFASQLLRRLGLRLSEDALPTLLTPRQAVLYVNGLISARELSTIAEV
jgi:minimal PKS acyl carrier protein